MTMKDHSSTNIGQKKVVKKTTDYELFLILGLLGFLLGSIALSTVLTSYLKQRSCSCKSVKRTSITTTTTTTTSTSVTSTTSTTTTTSTTSTTTSTTTTVTTTTTSTTTTTTQTVAPNSTSWQYYCARISSYTLWNLYGTQGLYMDIDTSNCSFTATPLYFTSMAGDSVHDDLSGYTAIYSPSQSTFRVYTQSLPGYSSATLYSYSQTYRWDVNWIGIAL